ncbi:hypothetical protein GCM10023082_35380 [Streptomyces tremellae]|uniref:Phosphatase n=1 Tax=Streptomyces tremellae TaxID=1124239 RepID=A0ABP7FAS2_9ACTN
MIGVSGVAGSGKSTLGRALAEALRLPLLDLDTLTTTLLERLPDESFGERWLAHPRAADIRAARYAALRATASDVVATAGSAVLVAPFTAELTGGPEWTALTRAVAPAALRMVHLKGDPELFARRRAGRAAGRDAYRPDAAAPPAPAVPHLPVDAELSPDQQRFRVLRALGHRLPQDPDAALFARTFDAVLFDLDGVLADSTASVLRSWDRFTRERGLPTAVVEHNHGRPARVLMEQLVPPEQVADGLRRIEELEVRDASTVDQVPGARALTEALPPHRYAIATSGSLAVASARLDAAGLAAPRVFVTADVVGRAKPDPEPYLRAAAGLGFAPERCVVVEDAPAGVTAARAAGCAVVGVLGTVPPEELDGADVVVDGLDRLRVVTADGGLRLSPVEAPGPCGH